MGLDSIQRNGIHACLRDGLGVSLGRRSESGRLLPGALTFPVVLELELMVFSEGSLQSVLSMALVRGEEQQ